MKETAIMRARRDNRFSRAFCSAEQINRRRRTDKDLAFERKIVRKLLKRFGVPNIRIITEQEDYLNDDNQDLFLTFRWLKERDSGFPIRLIRENTWRGAMEDLVQKEGEKTRLSKVWEKNTTTNRNCFPADSLFAIAMPTIRQSCWAGEPVIMHNAVLQSLGSSSMCCFDPRGQFMLEGLESFADHIALTYTADKDGKIIAR